MLTKRSFYLSLFFIPTIILGIALGIWQYERSIWKQDLLKHYQERIHKEPTALSTVIIRTKGDQSVIGSTLFKSFDLYPISLEGYFVTDLVYYRPIGNGIELITGFKTQDGVIAVNAGTMSYGAKEVALSKLLPQEKITITGFYRSPEPYGDVLPKNKSLVARIPYLAFFDHYNSEMLAGSLQVNTNTPISPYLKGRSGEEFIDNIPNNHTQYMWTWFMLAMIASIFYVLLLGRANN